MSWFQYLRSTWRRTTASRELNNQQEIKYEIQFLKYVSRCRRSREGFVASRRLQLQAHPLSEELLTQISEKVVPEVHLAVGAWLELSRA